MTTSAQIRAYTGEITMTKELATEVLISIACRWLENVEEGLEWNLTREWMLKVLIDTASRWLENEEERLPSRISPFDTDDVLRHKCEEHPDGFDEDEFEDAKFIRDGWQAIDLLSKG
jgi:hypothetical protein